MNFRKKIREISILGILLVLGGVFAISCGSGTYEIYLKVNSKASDDLTVEVSATDSKIDFDISETQALKKNSHVTWKATRAPVEAFEPADNDGKERFDIKCTKIDGTVYALSDYFNSGVSYTLTCSDNSLKID